MTILGIDPGTARVGYGVVKKEGGKIMLVSAGLLRVKKKGPPALQEIGRGIEDLVEKFKPEKIAVEKLYFAKNQKTALSVAEARGVVLLTALKNNLKIYEYSPNEVKSSITGYGLADKKAVLKMVRLIRGEAELKVIDDASDALALAILASDGGN